MIYTRSSRTKRDRIGTKIADYFIRTRQIPYLYIMQLCYRCLIRPKEILMLKINDIDFV